jgi:cyclase
MFRPRVIVTLLLKNKGLVKGIKFKNHKYVGDPLNAVKIFNDKKADELVFLDIQATNENRNIDISLVKAIGDQCNMPFSVGGGIRSIAQIKDCIKAGAEKVVINTYAFENPYFIKEASDYFGSSTIVVSIDVKKNLFGKYQVYTNSGAKNTSVNPIEYATLVEQNGAGEIIVNSIDNDGAMQGYDLELTKLISENVSIPVIALGGAGNLTDFKLAIEHGNASAVAAGSLFVYYGHRRAVLINYPDRETINQLFYENTH